MDVLGRFRAERLGQLAVQRLVRPVVVAADDVRDPEVDVVDDARELIRRRPVLAEQRDPRRTGRRLQRVAAGRRDRAPGARSGGSGPRPSATPSHSRSRRISSSPPGTLRAGSVSSIRSRKWSPKLRLATALRAFPTWSEPVGLGAKRTLFICASLEVERVADVERIRRELHDPLLPFSCQPRRS